MSSYLTPDEINLLQTTSLSRATPFVIRGVSESQFSIARYYGGIRLDGASYTYEPTTDELIRNDVLTLIERRRRQAQRDAVVKSAATQRTLEF